jgi:hypothetical protein
MIRAACHAHAYPRPDWPNIDTVCLDLDGTLLDQAYDNHIWRDLVPQRFAVAHSLDMHAAYAEIARRFEAVRGTLDWYCIEHWSRNLGIDIGALHREVRSHVAWLPGARDFLVRLRAGGKRLLLLTNSHPIALAVKHEQTGVLDYFDASVSSHEFGTRRNTAISGAPRSGSSASIRRAACSWTTIPGCSRPRLRPACAGSTASATGTPRDRSANTRITPASTASPSSTAEGWG